MIKLVYDDVEIVVKPENSLYKTLKRFAGESFQVVAGEERVQREPETQPEQMYEQVELRAEPYYNLFNDTFEGKSASSTLLKSHLDNVFTSKKVNVDLLTTDAFGNKLLKSTHGFMVVDHEH